MTERPSLIDTPPGLEHLAEELDRHRVIGVDTESNSFFAYRDRVSLLQFSSPAGDYLVDPLALDDFSCLDRVMTDPSLVKVFHDGEQDLQLLQRDLGLSVRGLFDTKVVVSAFAGRSQGLAGLVEECFGVELDKKCQRSDWGRRPLSAEQLEYAKLDTRYLISLRERLAADLAAADPTLTGLVEMEHARIEASPPLPRDLGPEYFHKVKGARRLSPDSLRLLAELYRGRDGWAQQRDMPVGKALPDPVLVALAKARPDPDGPGDLESRAKVPRRSLRRHREWIVEALRRARAAGPLAWEDVAGTADPSPPDEAVLAAQDALRAWRRGQAETLACESALVLNRVVLERLCRARPTDLEGLAALEGITPWWADRFGPSVLQALEAARQEASTQGRRKPWRRR